MLLLWKQVLIQDHVSSGQLRCLSCRQTHQNMSTLSRDKLNTIIRLVMDTFVSKQKNPTKHVHPVQNMSVLLYNPIHTKVRVVHHSKLIINVQLPNEDNRRIPRKIPKKPRQNAILLELLHYKESKRPLHRHSQITRRNQ